jgi:hypothetical protein
MKKRKQNKQRALQSERLEIAIRNNTRRSYLPAAHVLSREIWDYRCAVGDCFSSFSSFSSYCILMKGHTLKITCHAPDSEFPSNADQNPSLGFDI